MPPHGNTAAAAFRNGVHSRLPGRYFPSPLVGEGREGGSAARRSPAPSPPYAMAMHEGEGQNPSSAFAGMTVEILQ